MRRFAVRRPLLFAALAIVAGDLLASLTGRLLRAFDLPVMTRMLIGEPIFALYTAVLLTALGWWREAGFRRPARGRDTLVYLPWLVLPLLQASDFQASAAGPGLILATAVFALLVGFAEEGVARGVMLRALLPGGAERAALLSSALFGAAHLSSALAGRGAARARGLRRLRQPRLCAAARARLHDPCRRHRLAGPDRPVRGVRLVAGAPLGAATAERWAR